ncbi:MATE family efflux transporter [Nitrincola alkalisediminis]
MLAWPIMIAQLAQNTMGFVDTLMSARAGSEDLAAIALGSSLWLPIFLALAGILMATTPIVAHHVGAQDTHKVRSTFYQGLWVALFLGAISVFLLQNTSIILSRLSLEPSLQAKTEGYLAAISWGFPALLLLQVIRGFSEGHGRTKAVMKIALLGLLCNIPLNYIFIFGKLGLPALGGVGCGIASAIVMWIMLFAGTLYLNKSKFFAHLSFKWQVPIPSQLIAFLKLGTPIGFALLIESSMFSVIALLIAPYGETVIAANQITISFTGLIFMIPLSIAMALTIRVGQLAGAKQILEARKAAFTGIYLTLLIAFFTCLFVFLFVRSIVGLYTSETNIVSLATQLLLIAALFQFSDAIQVCAAGALRGYKDTAVPLLLVFISFWIIGLPSGYILGLTDIILPAQGAAGFWYGLLIGLSFGAVMLLSRLHRVSKHDYQSR